MGIEVKDLVDKYGLAEGVKAYLEVQVYGRYTLPDGAVIACAFPDNDGELAKAFEENNDG